MLNPSPMEAAILDDSGPVRSRHLGDDSGQVWFKLALKMCITVQLEQRKTIGLQYSTSGEVGVYFVNIRL
jgi:hypothetical protein